MRPGNLSVHVFSARRCDQSIILLVFILAGVTAWSATISQSSLQLQSLTITPSSGAIMFAPTAQSFAQAQNSQGDLISDFQSGATANSSVGVTWAAGNGSADSSSEEASAFANLNIPTSGEAAASSVGRGTLYDFNFQITGTTGSVPVNFSAMLPFAQLLMTDSLGLEASSEIMFELSIDGNLVLFSDSPMSIGSSSSASTSGIWNLSNSVDLTAGQSYELYIELDGESSGKSTPEPSALYLLGSAVLPILCRRLRRSVG